MTLSIDYYPLEQDNIVILEIIANEFLYSRKSIDRYDLIDKIIGSSNVFRPVEIFGK